MSDAKIQVTLGSIMFSGEGPQDWLEKQLDKILQSAPDLLNLAQVAPPEKESSAHKHHPKPANGATLASFLTAKSATTNQVKKFLATAEWLHTKGQQKLASKDVAKTLSTGQQKRLANPADCLNKNVAKGFCEKDGNEFYVTPEGRASLG